MPVKITQKTSKPAEPKEVPSIAVNLKAADYNEAFIIDKAASLEQEIKAMKAKLKPKEDQFAKMKEQILSIYSEDLAKADGTMVEAKEFGAEIGAASIKREVTNKAELLEVLGMERFVQLANFKLTDIDSYLTPEEKAKVLTEERTGARSVKFYKVVFDELQAD